MRRRQGVEPPGEPPPYLRRMDMGRYRPVIAESLARAPLDYFRAGIAAWRVWCGERHAWERAHGIGPADWQARNELLGAITGPDFRWICEEYGLPLPAPPDLPQICPADAS